MDEPKRVQWSCPSCGKRNETRPRSDGMLECPACGHLKDPTLIPEPEDEAGKPEEED